LATVTDRIYVAPATSRRRRFILDSKYISLLTVLVIFALWTIATQLRVFDPLFVPGPLAVWDRVVEVLRDGYRFTPISVHIWASVQRMGLGWGLAVATAVPLGLLMGTNRIVEAICDPIIEFIRPLPPLAYYMLLILWFGIGDESKVALLYLAALPYVLINTRSGVKGVKIVHRQMAEAMGANRWQMFAYVIFPSTLPMIFAGMRLALGNTFGTLVAAEIVAASSGIGWLILDASRYLQTATMFMGILIIGLLAVSADFVLRRLEMWAVPWRGRD